MRIPHRNTGPFPERAWGLGRQASTVHCESSALASSAGLGRLCLTGDLNLDGGSGLEAGESSVDCPWCHYPMHQSAPLPLSSFSKHLLRPCPSSESCRVLFAFFLVLSHAQGGWSECLTLGTHQSAFWKSSQYLMLIISLLDPGGGLGALGSTEQQLFPNLLEVFNSWSARLVS